MNYAILRVSYLPYPHLCFAVRTAQGISTGTGLVAFSIALGRNNLDGPLDDALDLGQGVMNQALDLGKRLGGLYAVDLLT